MQKKNHWWFVARRDILNDVINEICMADGSKNIVEIGCGTGRMCSLLSRKYNVVGYDTSEAAINIACDTYKGVVFHKYEKVEELRECLALADLVLMFDVLEHIEDDASFLSTIISMVPTGAQFLLTVPALMSLWGEQDVVVGHYRRYDVRTLQNSWLGSSVSCEWLSYFNAYLYLPILFARTLSRWFRLSFGKGGMDYGIPPWPINSILTKIFRSERVRIGNIAKRGRGKGFGIGSSLITLLKKTK